MNNANTSAATSRIWIDHRQDGNKHAFTPFATLSPGETGRYLLVIEKMGSGGVSRNRQSGALPAASAPDSDKALSTSDVSIDADDAWTATLTVDFDSGETLTTRLNHENDGSR